MTYDVDVSRQSPNFDVGRTKPILMVVIHATVGGLQSSLNWLCVPSSGVSVHYLIAQTGKIYQLVADSNTAWHAGKSKWNDIIDANACSIGIELENANDGKDPYEPGQIAALTWLVEFKAHQFGIELDNIVRHLDVAIPSGRKTDPANAIGFQWANWKKGLTIGSDEAIWDLWGVTFPLYPDTRHFGIPQAWFKRAALLGEARSNPIYADDIVFQCFQRGIVLYRDGKSKVVLDSDIG